MRRFTLALFVLLPLVVFARAGGASVADGGVSTDFTLSIDCDTLTAGVQPACTVPAGPLMDVGIVLTNTSGAPREVNGVTFVIHSPDTARLNPPPVGCGGVCLDSNPNFWQQSVPVPGDWDCDPPTPDNDTGADGPGQAASFLECRNAAETGPLLAAGASVLVATNRYLVVSSAPAGSVALTLSNATVEEAVGSEIGSCAPSGVAPMTCAGATVTVARVSLQLDCNAVQPGIQSKCYVSNLMTTRDVVVVLKNNSNITFEPGDFNFELLNPDITRLSAQIVMPPLNTRYNNGNPDAHTDLTPLGSWFCGPFGPYSDNDADGDPQTQQSFIACYNAGGDGGVIGPGGTLRLATVHYNITAGADPGPVLLSPQFAGTRDETAQERGSCEPVVSVAMDCDDAEIVFYCQIEQADVVGIDGRVNSGDLGKVASVFGQLPAPPLLDQNVDGLINSGDLGLVASVFNQYVTACP